MTKEEKYDISNHLDKIEDKDLLKYFNDLRERISSLGEDIEEKIIKHRVVFTSNNVFCRIGCRKNFLRISLKINVNPKDYPNLQFYEENNPEWDIVKIDTNTPIEDLMSLIELAYENQLEDIDTIESGIYDELPLSERRILTDKTDPNIRDICERVDKEKLIARADFQRNYVWENQPIIKSRLIESILLNVPIPIIYTAETEKGDEVIDGQQRILTFFGFKNNKFPLKGLNIMSELNGKYFKDLPEDLQDKFLTRGLTIIKILFDSQKDIKFEIFVRLNRGSVKLNEQELRNCIYRGNFNNLLKELVKNRDFLRLQGIGKPDKRMKDVERILRFFAFCDKGEHNYRSPLKKFLNDYMQNKKDLLDKELEDKRKLFKKCIELCEQVFGEISFRRWYLGDEDNPDGEREEKINEGLMDVQLYGFMQYEKRDISGKEQIIKDEFIKLISSDKEIIESIEKGTYGTSQVKLRTEKWFRILRDIIGYPENDERIYNFKEKKYLFDKYKGICQLCKNKIHSIDDAHVDHIKRFSEGGKTTIENGQITHRYCNLRKG